MVATGDERICDISGTCADPLLPTNCLSVFEHFVGLSFEGFMIDW